MIVDLLSSTKFSTCFINKMFTVKLKADTQSTQDSWEKDNFIPCATLCKINVPKTDLKDKYICKIRSFISNQFVFWGYQRTRFCKFCERLKFIGFSYFCYTPVLKVCVFSGSRLIFVVVIHFPVCLFFCQKDAALFMNFHKFMEFLYLLLQRSRQRTWRHPA